MFINSLSVANFRNLEFAEIKFNERLNLIIGNNGQGKTNIIEAIYLMRERDSFRYSKNENLIQIGKNQAAIRSLITDRGLDFKLSLKISNLKKELNINEKINSVSKIKNFSIVLFSPESLNVIKESSDERRQLIDQLIKQITPNGEDIIYEFKKILKTRNKLLKDISEEKINYDLGRDTLESINVIFLKKASEITFLRIKLLNEIKFEVEKILNNISNTGSIKFDFNYIISEKNYKNSNPEIILEALRNRLTELEVAEIKSGVSLIGPQKHDVIFLYNGNDSRYYCSQGQQRSIILAYKMAQIVYHQKVHGFYPLLLLDDVLSELDLLKQDSLISTLNQTETQTFVTTTDVSLLSKLSMDKASVFKIQNGQVIA